MKEIYTALITPFNEEKAIDYQSLDKLLQHLLLAGNDHFVVGGTTGEAPTLQWEEKKHLISYIGQQSPHAKIVFGVSSNNTKECIRQIQELETNPYISAFMVVVPYYNKPSQEGIYQHFEAIAKATKKDLIIYNVPGRTSSNISIETICQLLENNKTIIGLKQAGDIDGIETIKQKFPNFKIYIGNDNLLYEGLQKGADGIISVASHIVYPLIKNICESNNPFLDDYLKMISHYLFLEPSPAPVKYVLSNMGIIKNELRLPLVPVSKSLQESLDSLVTVLKR